MSVTVQTRLGKPRRTPYPVGMSSVRPEPQIANRRRRRPESPASPVEEGTPAPPRWRTTLGLGLLSAGLLFASFPPLDLWPLAWLAPVPWLWLVRQERLPCRRPYRALWLAGVCFWLATLHWLRLPHPATSIGWVALSVYLGVYLPLFVGLSRVAVHRLRCPLALAAPVVWTGLELAQAHLLTGFLMAPLGQTQHRWISLIQVADLAGSYGASLVVMCAAACLAATLPCGTRGWRFWPLAPAAAVLAATLAYGRYRLDHEPGSAGAKIALIQGSIDTELKSDPQKHAEVARQYVGLSERAVRAEPALDLIVWPETMFREPLFTCAPDMKPPEEWDGTPQEFLALVDKRRDFIGELAVALGAPMLLGIDTVHFGPHSREHYNSALLVERDGRLGPRYDKTHPVMFGEYVPLARQLPWVQSLTPLPVGIEAGSESPAFEVAGVRLATNICYESVLPHIIREQVAAMCAAGREPDVLVNLTNDGWFWGSSELDLHLACDVFRAVECRKPFLVAANTGFSAWIDDDGRIVKRGPRRATDVLVADVRLTGRRSPYLAWGDWPAGLCLAACLMLAAIGLHRGFRVQGSGFSSAALSEP